MTEYDAGVKKLEEELSSARRFGARALRELHALMVAELRDTRGQLRRARRRARRAERELAAIKATRTWKARRTVGAASARFRRPGP